VLGLVFDREVCDCNCLPAGEMSRSLDCIINRLQLALACVPIQQNQLLAQELVRDSYTAFLQSCAVLFCGPHSRSVA
jgi:hypothetical protein